MAAVFLRRALNSKNTLALRTAYSIHSNQTFSYLNSSYSHDASDVADRSLTLPLTDLYHFNTRRGYAQGRKQKFEEEGAYEDKVKADLGASVKAAALSQMNAAVDAQSWELTKLCTGRASKEHMHEKILAPTMLRVGHSQKLYSSKAGSNPRKPRKHGRPPQPPPGLKVLKYIENTHWLPLLAARPDRDLISLDVGSQVVGIVAYRGVAGKIGGLGSFQDLGTKECCKFDQKKGIRYRVEELMGELDLFICDRLFQGTLPGIGVIVGYPSKSPWRLIYNKDAWFIDRFLIEWDQAALQNILSSKRTQKRTFYTLTNEHGTSIKAGKLLEKARERLKRKKISFPFGDKKLQGDRVASYLGLKVKKRKTVKNASTYFY